MTYTVLGASGFIGSHLVRWLHSAAFDVWAPERGTPVSGRALGNVIYCIGVTADFRRRTYDTVRAHVGVLLDILDGVEFESLLYLSSTRVYRGLEAAQEGAWLRVNPLDPGDLYNLSKLMGESLCLSCGRPNVRVVRLSNVYGDDFSSENFLFTVLRDAVDRRRVVLRTTLDSEKDYVDVRDVVRLLPRIAAGGRCRVYNIASGVNTSNAQLMEILKRETACRVQVEEGAPALRFPRISIERVSTEFSFVPAQVLDSYPSLVAEYQRRIPTH